MRQMNCGFLKEDKILQEGEEEQEKIIDEMIRLGGSMAFPFVKIGDFQYVGMLLSKVKTYDLETYPVKVEGNSITVDVD